MIAARQIALLVGLLLLMTGMAQAKIHRPRFIGQDSSAKIHRVLDYGAKADGVYENAASPDDSWACKLFC
ncbi:hypothetical protein Q31b_17850 [Novipirellula aureliae]|uniref:Uncharacterized protein n=1 Tax=Novipirellula aureliae TaxID=2527966 RepID=A0A5C6EAR0_9BACT|nr:hypothetical protein [Novipirellula aureliae]TWU44249.1 hypothetical protein Q31b_17850 [Novipirellula aureliae]